MDKTRLLKKIANSTRETNSLPFYLKDEAGNRLKTEKCVVDSITFKKRLIKMKLEGG